MRRKREVLAPHTVGDDGALAIQNELWDEYVNRIEDNPGVEPDGGAILEDVLLAKGLPSDRGYAEQVWERSFLGIEFFGAQLF